MAPIEHSIVLRAETRVVNRRLPYELSPAATQHLSSACFPILAGNHAIASLRATDEQVGLLHVLRFENKHGFMDGAGFLR